MSGSCDRGALEPMNRILVVEDSPTQAAEFAFILEDAGFEVEVAADGKQGLERARSARFDVRNYCDVLLGFPLLEGEETLNAKFRRSRVRPGFGIGPNLSKSRAGPFYGCPIASQFGPQ